MWWWKKKENNTDKIDRIIKDFLVNNKAIPKELTNKLIKEVEISMEQAQSIATQCIDEFVRISYPKKMEFIKDDLDEIKNLPFSKDNLDLINKEVDQLCKNRIDYEEFIDYVINVKILESETWLTKGEKFLNQNKLEEAVDCFDTSLEFSPENISSLIARGQLLQTLNFHIEAIDDFTEVINDNEDEFNVIYLRGCSYLKIGDLNNAFSDINKAIKLSHLANEKQISYAKEQGFSSIDMMYKSSLDLINTLRDSDPIILKRMKENNSNVRI